MTDPTMTDERGRGQAPQAPPPVPRYVNIFDTTLRDGEQAPGASMNETEKLEIAQQLARMGVDVIEAGFPIASKGDFDSVALIAREVRGSRIAGLARAIEQDVRVCWDAVKAGRRGRASTPSSRPAPIHLKYQIKKTRRRGARHHARDGEPGARAWPRSTPRPTSSSAPWTPAAPSPSSWPRSSASPSTCGATTINVPDTVGYALPLEWGDFIREQYRLCPALDDVTVSVHCHNDLGLATANSLAAVRAGATQVECAVNGIGERAGNASLEEVVMALATRGAYFGATTGIVTEEIARSSRMVSNLTGYVIQPNKAIVGRNAFAHESGIHQAGLLDGVVDLRDHEAGRRGSRRQRPRAGQALRASRPARAASRSSATGSPTPS